MVLISRVTGNLRTSPNFSGKRVYQKLASDSDARIPRMELNSVRSCSSQPESLPQRDNLTRKLTFILLFFSVLVSGNGAYPSNQKVVRKDGIEYRAAESVSDEAFERAQFVVQQMLSKSPKIREKMVAIGFKVEIIGKDQVLSDLPDYAHLKGKRTRDGRDFDTGTRGLGGREMCSIGAENLLCLSNQPYRRADIFVHEFSHSMMANMDADEVREVEAAYKNAVHKKLYPKGIYMMVNSREYWAEGVQAWLGVTLRTDVNGGFNTQQKIRDHDQALAAVLEKVYGSLQLQHSPGCTY
jgi:hypothetical protein